MNWGIFIVGILCGIGLTILFMKAIVDLAIDEAMTKEFRRKQLRGEI